MIFIVLLLFPLAVAAAVPFVKNDAARGNIVRAGAIAVALLSIAAVCAHFQNGAVLTLPYLRAVKYGMMLAEAAIAVYIIRAGLKSKKILAPLLAGVQTPALILFELFYGKNHEAETTILFDRFSAVMVLIIGVIGGLICIYAVGYMRWYHVHHTDHPARKGFFFAVLFLFLSAMTGLVLFNDITMMYFCWELTTFCSFLLIGYTKTKEAADNSFRALTINLLGGAAFAAGIIFIGLRYETAEISALLRLRPETMLFIPLFLFAFAALTKSAQFPFASWLLGAMVAPTPTSALLHSATMVKAGVYFIIRLAPLLGAGFVGKTVTLVGGISFVAASFIAVSQSDAKKILAYSTIANLGLIVACAGIGTAESLWAAMLLIIFHAIAKSLLFLAVGSIEHQIGSRSVEDMDALLGVSKWLSLFMIIGIAGMFLAPFGMLISKWAAMKAFIDSDNFYIVVLLVFGSAATLFYWTKWMGKIIGSVNKKRADGHTFHREEQVPLLILAVMTIAACLVFPVISKYAILPYLRGVFHVLDIRIIGNNDILIMIVMLSMLIVLPVSFLPIYKADRRRIVPVYMAGENAQDDQYFYGAMGKKVRFETHNWYMDAFFGERKLLRAGNAAALAAVLANIFLIVWKLMTA